MSTLYTVEISSSDGTTGTVEIDISFIPLQSTWKSVQAGLFSLDSGMMRNNSELTGKGITPLVFLTGFPKQHNGKGGKYDPDGTFPQGELDWEILKQD